MAKQRKSKRQLVRDERRKKKRELDFQDDEMQEETRDAKRQRKDTSQADDSIPLYFEDDRGSGFQSAEELGELGHADISRYGDGPGNGAQTQEFFGLLSDSEQEYFRRADELLELNEFGEQEERRVFVENVFREAQGKELKLASSQSSSRLMERLIQLATDRQRRWLFNAFSGHMMTLVTHRFASHCCEQLFLQAAKDVGETNGKKMASDEDEGEFDDNCSTEQRFLHVLDELEPHMAALLTDRFASHVLRVLLVVLSGRPLDELATRSLLQSRKKETITVAAAGERQVQGKVEARIVPDSFTAAVHKIIADIAAELDPAALRVLATHPTGNPVLQLLVELEMSERNDSKKTANSANTIEASCITGRLLPGAPASLGDSQSPAAELLRTLVYDRIGSRLLETLVTNSPGKLFKAIYTNVFAHRESAPEGGGEGKETGGGTPPMAVFLRNEIACYPAMRVLERIGRDELAGVVSHQILAPLPLSGRVAVSASLVEQLVLRQRFSVLRTLFVRCDVRGVNVSLLQRLTEALRQAVSAERQSQAGRLIERLCFRKAETNGNKADEAGEVFEPLADNTLPPPKDSKSEQRASVHGCYLVSSLLAIPGAPTAAVQSSLLALSTEQLVRLATESSASAAIVVAAISSNLPTRGGNNNASHIPLSKQLVSRLLPSYLQLATSQIGHVVLLAIMQRPSRVDLTPNEEDGSPATGRVATGIPFHLKDAFVAQFTSSEDELRASWPGRIVWRSWRCDLWRSRRTEWVRWMKAGEPEGLQKATAPIATRAWDADKKKMKMERKTDERGSHTIPV